MGLTCGEGDLNIPGMLTVNGSQVNASQSEIIAKSVYVSASITASSVTANAFYNSCQVPMSDDFVIYFAFELIKALSRCRNCNLSFKNLY